MGADLRLVSAQVQALSRVVADAGASVHPGVLSQASGAVRQAVPGARLVGSATAVCGALEDAVTGFARRCLRWESDVAAAIDDLAEADGQVAADLNRPVGRGRQVPRWQ